MELRSVFSNRRFLVVLQGVLILFLSTTLLYLIKPGGSIASGWKTYTPVLIRSGILSSSRAEELDSVLPGIVSQYTSTVEIENFAGHEEITLADLDNRLDPLDPRLDPFLVSVRSLFSVLEPSGSYDVVYLNGKIENRELRRRVKGILPVDAVVIPGRNDGTRWIFTGAAMIVLLFLVYRTSLPRFLLVVPLVSAIRVVYMGGAPALVRVVLLFLALLLFLEMQEERQRQRLYTPAEVPWSHLIGIAVFVLGAFVTLLFDSSGWSALWSTALLILQIPALEILRHFFTARRLSRSEHRVFSPLPIMERSWYEYFSAFVSRGFAWAPSLVVVVLFSVHFLVSDADYTVPVPVGSDESVAMMDELPSVLGWKGYIAHRAYQEALVYGWPFVAPETGEELTVTDFSRENDEIIADNQVVFRFDDEWFSAVSEVRGDGSLYDLFVRESPALFCRGDFSPSTTERRDLTGLVLVCFLSLLIPLSVAARLRFAVSAGRFAFIMKRNRQEI